MAKVEHLKKETALENKNVIIKSRNNNKREKLNSLGSTV